MKDIESQLQKYIDFGYKGGELIEIRLGLEHNLSIDDINVYANGYANANLMRELRLGFESGVNILKELNLKNGREIDLNNKVLSVREIRLMLNNNFSLRGIYVALLENDYKLIRALRVSNIVGLNLEKLLVDRLGDFYTTPFFSDKLNYGIINVLSYAKTKGFGDSQILELTNYYIKNNIKSKLNDKDIEKIYGQLIDKGYSVTEINNYLEKNISHKIKFTFFTNKYIGIKENTIIKDFQGIVLKDSINDEIVYVDYTSYYVTGTTLVFVILSFCICGYFAKLRK